MSATKPAITRLNAELFVVLILITKAPLSSLPTALPLAFLDHSHH
jgi:hypothetical protein